jgi:hypothetical protein
MDRKSAAVMDRFGSIAGSEARNCSESRFDVDGTPVETAAVNSDLRDHRQPTWNLRVAVSQTDG